MQNTRRLFLKRAALVVAAPAVIRITQLMPVKPYDELASFWDYGNRIIVAPKDFIIQAYDGYNDCVVDVPVTLETYNRYIKQTGQLLVGCIPKVYA